MRGSVIHGGSLSRGIYDICHFSLHLCIGCFLALVGLFLQGSKLYGRPINSQFSIVMAPNLNWLITFVSKEERGET